MKLSRKDTEEIRAVLARLNVARHVRERGAAALIRDWAQFVEAVRDGFSDDESEYTNDLSARDIIQSVLDRVSPPVRSRLEAEVAPIDELFLAATVDGSGPRHAVYEMTGRAWWWLRDPKIPPVDPPRIQGKGLH
ncbi:MAG: hypothetical protein ACRDFX_09310 [Chloroflexota bacterium]